MNKLSIVLLVSGGLGMQTLSQLHEAGENLAGVFTNKTSTSIIDFCRKHNIAHFVGNPRNGKASHFIQELTCDILLSVNYLFIIEQDLIHLAQQYAINIHGSLLPKYRGRTPHVWAIINGEKETGITAHLIDEVVDNGAIIKQITVPIGEEDTGADILSYFHDLYPQLIDEILVDICASNLKFVAQKQGQASYFGKRTPDDGRINWDWSKERIRNWIRAQAKPYPGAFTFLDTQKIEIHKATFSEQGFRYDMPNGLILVSDPSGITVKVANGVLKLSQIEGVALKDLMERKILH